MKKIVPFKKEIAFKTNISEITSISLEHNLHLEKDNFISGNFIISGEYKVADSSINTDIFNFELPFDINVDDKYILDNVVIDIDDFYYEIVNNKMLEVNIDVLVDKLVERPLITKKIVEEDDKLIEEVSDVLENEVILDDVEEDEEIMERCIEKEDILENIEDINNNVNDDNQLLNNLDINQHIENTTKREIKSIEKINSLFDNLDSSSETYKTYKVCIIRNGDTVESVLQKYSITKEELEKYNILTDVKIGDKLIIPSINDEKV